MNRAKLAFSAALFTSISANVYLFKTVVEWQDAWVEQILTTSNVEVLYKNSGADLTVSSIKNLVRAELGEYEVVPIGGDEMAWAVTDEDAVLIHGTKLYFKEGVYVGSKANIPDHLVHWGFGQE